MKTLQNIKKRNISIGIIILVIAMAIIFIGEGIVKINGLTLAPNKYEITIDGKAVEFDSKYGVPYTIRETNRVVVPVRIISETMSYKVDWENSTRTAIVKGGGQEIKVKIGDNFAMVNGKKVFIDTQDGKVMDTKALLVPVEGSSRTYLPLRFIVDNTGGRVVRSERINGVQYVDIVTGKEPTQTPEPEPKPEPEPEPKPTPGDKDSVSKDWIEPDLKAYVMPGRAVSSNHFYVKLHNFEDYKDKDISITATLEGYEYLRKYRSESVMSAGKLITLNDDTRYESWGHDKIRSNSGIIYEMPNIRYKQNLHNENYVTPPAEGSKMIVKIVVRQGKDTKTYYRDCIFTNKIYSRGTLFKEHIEEGY